MIENNKKNDQKNQKKFITYLSHNSIEYQKIIFFQKKIIKEISKKDPWTALICSFKNIPFNIKQIMIHSWKEEADNIITLNLRSSKYHLNITTYYNKLYTILSNKIKYSFKLNIIENNDKNHQTPFELYYTLYKNIQLKSLHIILSDDKFQKLVNLFDITYDYNNIYPI